MTCFTDHDPRYRVWHSPETASFEDLLAVLISHGYSGRNVKVLSQELALLAGSEPGLFELEAGAITSVKGMGPAKAAVILAAIELCRRKSLQRIRAGRPFAPRTLARFLRERLQGRGDEYYYLFSYNRTYRLIRRHLLNRGNPDSVHVYYRDILKTVLNDRCSNIVVAHNHPDAGAEPSQIDLDNMELLDNLLAPVGVRLTDQYVVGNNGVYSCRLAKMLIKASDGAE